MNAKQRRKAYRSIDRMAGRVFEMLKPSGKTITMTAIGRTKQAAWLASRSDNCTFDGGRPSTHRVFCVLDSGATMCPRISSLAPA